VTQHHLEIVPLSRHRWIVRYEGDPTPLAEQPTQADAVAEARNFARQFGETRIHVQELDGGRHDVLVDPDFRAPTPADVKGPHVEP
jgi:alpha-beta hydrolase superfamily lysophospholipase